MLELVDEQACQHGLGRIYLEVEKDSLAINLYKRSGYKEHNRYLLSKWL